MSGYNGNQADFTLNAVLKVKDEATGKFKNTARQLDKINGSAKQVGQAINQQEKSLNKLGVSAKKASADMVKMVKQVNQLANKTATPTVSIRDNISGKLDRIKNKLHSFENKTFTSTVKVVGQEFSGIKNKTSSMVTGMAMGAGAGMMGIAGIGLGLTNALKTSMDFEAKMAEVRAISGASGEDLANLTKKAKEMGATTKFSATEAAQAMKFMAMAGWDTKKIISGIPAVMSLAAASGEDLANVSDIVTDGLTAMGLKAEDAIHFSDVLAITANKSNTSIGQMGYAFKYAAPVAGAFKYRIEDVNLALGLLANSAIKGEQAGTTLRAIINGLTNPSKNAAAALNSIGLASDFAFDKATGKPKAFADVLVTLRERTKNLTEQQKGFIASAIGGEAAQTGLLAILNSSAEDFDNLSNSINNCEGAAQRISEIMGDNLKGKLTQLGSAFESLVIESVSDKNKDLSLFVDEITRLTSNLAKAIGNGETFKGILVTIKDVIHDLIGQTLKFDGLGSLLAGGTLVFGFNFIYKKIGSIIDKIKVMKKSLTEVGKTPLESPQSATKSALDNLTINAAKVILNGNVEGNRGNDYTIDTNEGHSKGSKGKTGKRGNLGRRPGIGRVATKELGEAMEKGATKGLLGKLGAGLKGMGKLAGKSLAFALPMAALDVATASPEDRGGAVARSIGGIGGMMVGAKMGAMAGGAIGGLFGGAGAIPGVAIGGTIGSIAGGLIGESAMDSLARKFDPNEKDSIGAKAAEMYQGMKANFKNMLEEHGRASIANAEIQIQQSQRIGEGFTSMFTSTAQQSQTTADFINNNLLWLENCAANAGQNILSGLTSIIGALKEAWSAVTSWFQTEVFTPIANGYNKAKSMAGAGISAVKNNMGAILSVGDTPAFATGTNYFSGGLAQINEHGGELVALPDGSKVYPAGASRQIVENTIAGGNNNQASPVINISGNTFTVREEADIHRIAFELATLVGQSQANYGGI